MQIPLNDFWMAVGAIITAAVVFAFTTERSLGKMLTRKEHEKICDTKNQQITGTLEKIDRTLEEHIRESREQWDRTNNALHGVGLKIAVIETKMKVAEHE